MDPRIADANARYFGLPSRILMENAGRGIADYIRDNFKANRIAIVCGTGNNAGDGFVVARHLENEYDVSVIMVQDPKGIRTRESNENYDLLSKCNVKITFLYNPPEEWNYDLIIDGMLGTGLMGGVREPYASYIRKLNSLNIPILSIDVPSGYGTDLEVKATTTISLHVKKTVDSIVLPIGIPDRINRLCGPGNVKFLYSRPEDAHKGQGGVLGIVGGSDTYHGAPAYSSMASGKICDLVYVFCPRQVCNSLRSGSPDMIIKQIENENIDMGVIDKLSNTQLDCLLCGVGAGRSKETVNALLRIYEKTNIPLVIDADGIYALKGHLDLLNENICMTPHEREFENLFGRLPDTFFDRKKIVEERARDHKCTILLKGKVDIISNGEQTWENVTGNRGMSTGGTGDVLSGCVAAFGTKNPLFESSLAAAFAVGLAGDTVYANQGIYFSTSDLLSVLPEVLAYCTKL